MLKHHLAILFMLISVYGLGQKNTYTFNEVGWQINFPSELNYKDSLTISKSVTTKFLSIDDSKGNSITFTVLHFTMNLDSNWNVLNNSLKRLTYLTQVPFINASKIDTSSSTEKISGILFEKFESILTENKNQQSVIELYSRLYRNYGLIIQVFFSDQKSGKKLLKIANNSRFMNDK